MNPFPHSAATLPILLGLSLSFSVVAADKTSSLQYQTWAQTAEELQREDMLEKNPASVILWAGSAYAKEYHSPRGHHFAVADVSHSLRSGVSPKAGERALSASCWTCKTPDAPRLMKELGVEGFSAKSFAELGPEIQNPVYCSDCHTQGSAELTLPRPHAQDAMAKVHKPFGEQNQSMQQSQVCGQCHVTYYFQPERQDKVNIPWIFGNSADEIEKYYDARQFFEWVHPVSRTPLVKARHPEFEHWNRSAHAKAGISCVTCHMTQETSADGKSFTNHKITNHLPDFEAANCSSCHQSQQQITQLIADNKALLEAKAQQLQELLIKAHYEAGAAWKAGAQWQQIGYAIMGIRHAQWRWDFAMSSHGIHAHNAKEGEALLEKGLEQIRSAREILSKLNADLGVTQVDYPDYSTKAKAQAAIGVELEKLTEEKQAFIETEVKKHWSKAANFGY